MNLFLVTSPFQYICAIEAKEHYKTKNNILLLVKQPREPGISQMARLINNHDWDHIVTIERKHRSFAVPKAIKKISHICQSNNINHFFHGEYNAWRTKLLLRNLPINKEVYFDDGTLTLSEYERFIKTKNVFYRPRLVNDLVIRLHGLKPIGHLPMSSNLELFTMFDIKKPIIPLIKNNFNILNDKYRLNSQKKKTSSYALFLGQGSIGIAGTKKEKYIDLIYRFAEKSKKPVLYTPHRTETEETRTLVQKIPNLTYHKPLYPIEVDIVESNLNISDVGGVSSTALFSIKMIYPEIQIYNAQQSADDYRNIVSFNEVLLMNEQLKDLNVIFF